MSAAKDAGVQAVVQGRVTQNGSAVPVGYARLLNCPGHRQPWSTSSSTPDKGITVASAPGDDEGPIRWGMLAVISLGVMALTLNWFDVATAIPLIGAEFHVGLGSLSLLISL